GDEAAQGEESTLLNFDDPPVQHGNTDNFSCTNGQSAFVLQTRIDARVDEDEEGHNGGAYDHGSQSQSAQLHNVPFILPRL
ncbi:unnamed protein product, partial [Amoebophrya sp. A120]